MKRLLHSILFFFLNSYVFSNNYAPKNIYLVDSLDLAVLSITDRQLIDSCLSVYHQSKEDTSRINALNNICENMMHADWAKYQFFQYDLINEALKEKQTKPMLQYLKRVLAGALNNIGFIYQKQGKISNALDYYHKSLKIYQEIDDKKGMSGALNNLGFIYDQQNIVETALNYYHQSLKIKEEVNDKKGISNLINNIARIYFKQGNFKKALDNYQKALVIQNKIGDKRGVAHSLNNIGVIYYNQNDNNNAMLYYQKALESYEQLGDKEGISSASNNIGYVELNKGSYLMLYNLVIEVWH